MQYQRVLISTPPALSGDPREEAGYFNISWGGDGAKGGSKIQVLVCAEMVYIMRHLERLVHGFQHGCKATQSMHSNRMVRSISSPQRIGDLRA